MIKPISFKGYDAAPIKNIYIESFYADEIRDELSAIGHEEGFNVKEAYDNDKWTQDRKCFITRDNKEYLIADGEVSDNFLQSVSRNENIGSERARGFLVGGNTFIGKDDKGEKFILLGQDNERSWSKKCIAQTYDVKPENIHIIPQQLYHLDMFMRPIGYPYVLVDDPEKTLKEVNGLKCNSKERQELKDNIKIAYSFKTENVADRTCKALKKAGFQPIRVSGVWGENINFMNAIANKHSDGTVSYITNSSECDNKLYKEIQKKFDSELKAKVPNLRNIYYIKGKNPNEFIADDMNHMMTTLKYRGGGIHCLTLEEPDFCAWG